MCYNIQTVVCYNKQTVVCYNKQRVCVTTNRRLCVDVRTVPPLCHFSVNGGLQADYGPRLWPLADGWRAGPVSVFTLSPLIFPQSSSSLSRWACQSSRPLGHCPGQVWAQSAIAPGQVWAQSATALDRCGPKRPQTLDRCGPSRPLPWTGVGPNGHNPWTGVGPVGHNPGQVWAQSIIALDKCRPRTDITYAGLFKN